ncbi:MAG: pitrilysin family protein [bacterium]
MTENYQKFTFENEITFICESVPYVESATIGVWVSTGSVFEEEKENGISHFIEHLLFKGTKKRSAREISETIEGLGGELNGFTGKEYSCYYAKLPSKHIEKAIELLSDIINNSLLKKEDIEMERNVILEEIARYEDTPEDEIHDLLIKGSFSGHPLGRPVIGKRETLSLMDREGILEFYQRFYTPKRMLIAISGNVNFEKAREFVFRYFSKGKDRDSEKQIPIPTIQSSIINKEKDTEQVHFCIGTRGLPLTDEKRFVLSILNTILGGGMSSRLFYEIREKRGLAYAIYSYPQSFRDCGLFAVYCGASKANYKKAISLIMDEFKKIKVEEVKEKELNKVKEQIKGAFLLSLENTANRMERLAKQEAYFKRQFSIDEIIKMIDEVSSKDILDLANSIFLPSQYSFAFIGPIKKKELSLVVNIF